MANQDMGWRNIHEKRGELREWSASTPVNSTIIYSATTSGSTAVVPTGVWFDNSSSAVQPQAYFGVSPAITGYSYEAPKDVYVKKDESPLEWLKRRVEELRINLIPEPAMA